jgi:hypothetical protein
MRGAEEKHTEPRNLRLLRLPGTLRGEGDYGTDDEGSPVHLLMS